MSSIGNLAASLKRHHRASRKSTATVETYMEAANQLAGYLEELGKKSGLEPKRELGAGLVKT